MADNAKPKETFVHKEKTRRKGLAALLLLLAGGGRKRAALVVAGVLVLFLFLGSSTSVLGRFADFAGKSGLGWVARAARGLDGLLKGASREELALAERGAAGSLSEGSGFAWKAYKQQAADLARGDADPGSMVSGGADLFEQAAAAPEAPKAGENERARPLSPEEVQEGGSPVLQLPSNMGAAKAGARSDVPSGAGFGGKGLFEGSAGTVDPKQAVLEARAGDASEPKAGKTKVGQKYRGRVTKFNGGGVDSTLSGGRSTLAMGNRYRYRLGLAFNQTEYAAKSDSIETAQVYGRAWATGEMAEKTISAASAGPVPTGKAGVSAGPIGNISTWDSSVQDCIATVDSNSDELNAINEQYKAEAKCLNEGCNGKEALSVTMNRHAEYFKGHSPPDCCDGGVHTWNHHANGINSAMEEWNKRLARMRELCSQSNEIQSRMANDPACAGSIPAATAERLAALEASCSDIEKDNVGGDRVGTISPCSDSECFFSFLGDLFAIFGSFLLGGVVMGFAMIALVVASRKQGWGLSPSEMMKKHLFGKGGVAAPSNLPKPPPPPEKQEENPPPGS